jgi:predicted component of type VI protein secretion system
LASAAIAAREYLFLASPASAQFPFRAIDRFKRNNEGSRGLDTQAKATMIVFGLAQLSRG